MGPGDAGEAFERLPGADGRPHAADRPVAASSRSTRSSRCTASRSTRAGGGRCSSALRAEHGEATAAIRRSRATERRAASPRSPRGSAASCEPFQWAGVRYVLDARRAFLADEQGLGKTVEALAALEADDAFPAIVVCPASLKLNWQRETRAAGCRTAAVAVVEGRVGGAADGATSRSSTTRSSPTHRETLARRRPRALVVDESHYCKNPRAKRTQAVRRLAEAVPPDGLRLALTGTPVLNHAEELIAQLRVIGRLEDFGSRRALHARSSAAS